MSELQKLRTLFEELGIDYEIRNFTEKPYFPEDVPDGTPVATIVKPVWLDDMLFDEDGNYLGTTAGDEIGIFYERGESMERSAPEFDSTSFLQNLRELRTGPNAPEEEGMKALARHMSVGMNQ